MQPRSRWWSGSGRPGKTNILFRQNIGKYVYLCKINSSNKNVWRKVVKVAKIVIITFTPSGQYVLFILLQRSCTLVRPSYWLALRNITSSGRLSLHISTCSHNNNPSGLQTMY
jgi:hypothetical protein